MWLCAMLQHCAILLQAYQSDMLQDLGTKVKNKVHDAMYSCCVHQMRLCHNDTGYLLPSSYTAVTQTGTLT